MSKRLLDEFLVRSPPWSNKEELPCVAVVELHLTSLFPLPLRFVEECGFGPVSPVFRVMPIEVADVVGSFAIAVPSQIFLHRHFRGTMRLALHYALIAHHCWLLELWAAETDELGQLLQEAH